MLTLLLPRLRLLRLKKYRPKVRIPPPTSNCVDAEHERGAMARGTSLRGIQLGEEALGFAD
jgi:hypothetical protein